MSPHGHRFRLGAPSFVAAFAALLAAAPSFGVVPGVSATSPSFRLVESTATSGGGPASSTSHRLVSCLNHDPTGLNASASFRLESGCGVASALQGLPAPLPIPLLPTSWLIVLAALVVGAAALVLRRTQRR